MNSYCRDNERPCSLARGVTRLRKWGTLVDSNPQVMIRDEVYAVGVQSEAVDRMLYDSLLAQNTLSHFFEVDLYHPS